MNTRIRAVFEAECSNVKFDKALAKKIIAFETGFCHKNEEHMAFFGGHLTGVQVVRFSSADRDNWFNLLEIDDISLEEKLLEVPAVNPNFIVSSDVFNQTCMWLIHKFMTSPLLNDEDKREAMVSCSLVMQYRFLTSLLFNTFRYPADPQTAEATYARLSNKFLLKQYGSWSSMLRARAVEFVSENNRNYPLLKEYKDDLAIINLINAQQGQIRDTFKSIVDIHMKTSKAGIKIVSVSTVMEMDGESILKDKTKNLSGYTKYVHSIISDRDSFIKNEILDIVEKIMHTMPPNKLVQALDWCCTNYRVSGTTEVEELIDLTMVHSFGYLSNNRTLIKNSADLPGLISRLRGVYMSSRSTDPELIKLRDLSESIVRKAINSKNDSVIASVRTGVLCYIVLRGFTKNHYTN